MSLNAQRTAIGPIPSVAVVRKKEADQDRIIVERVQAGDVAAFDLLIRKYRERLYSIVYNLIANREDASEVTQDAFIKAFRSINRFQGRSSFFTWLYRIGVNAATSYLRKNRFRRFFSYQNLDEETIDPELLNALTAKSDLDRPVLLEELRDKMNEALQQLSFKHRTVIILHEMEGMSQQEIAQVMKCSEGTVRSRLHYAKTALQQHLQDYLH